MKLAELREEAKRIDDDDMLDAMIKATRTLNWLIDYHGIELDGDIEFDEEGYIVLQKDAA